jgi:hypothetical protein
MVVLSKLIENFIIWLAVLSFCDFFQGQDVDLRSLDPRGGSDPRLSRMGDQDMRTLPGQLPNPLPPPIVEK